jgi:hypothetical protein
MVGRYHVMVGRYHVMVGRYHVMVGRYHVMAGLEPAIPSRKMRGETVTDRPGRDGRVKPGHDEVDPYLPRY